MHYVVENGNTRIRTIQKYIKEVNYDKSEQKYGVNITKSEIPKYSKGKAQSKKQDHQNKLWYKKFKDLVNLQHTHGGRTDARRKKKLR